MRFLLAATDSARVGSNRERCGSAGWVDMCGENPFSGGSAAGETRDGTCGAVDEGFADGKGGRESMLWFVPICGAGLAAVALGYAGWACCCCCCCGVKC